MGYQTLNHQPESELGPDLGPCTYLADVQLCIHSGPRQLQLGLYLNLLLACEFCCGGCGNGSDLPPCMPTGGRTWSEPSALFLEFLLSLHIKPQNLFIEHKSHISFISPHLSSELQTYIPNSFIQPCGSWVHHMLYVHHFQSTCVPNNILLQERANILYSTLLYLSECHHHSLSCLI